MTRTFGQQDVEKGGGTGIEGDVGAEAGETVVEVKDETGEGKASLHPACERDVR